MRGCIETIETSSDPPPAAPFCVGHVLIPGRGVDASIRADKEDVQLVRVARDRRDRSTRRDGAGQDVPPAAPLTTGDVAIPGRRVGLAVTTGHEDVQLVRIARNDTDRRPPGHVEGIDDHLGAQVVRDAPAHAAAGSTRR